MRKPWKQWANMGLAAIIAGCAGVFSCNAVLGVSDFQAGVCNEGDKQCAENTPQACDAGQWESLSPCEPQTCINGECIGECPAGSVRCADDTPQACNEMGEWTWDAACKTNEEVCQAGRCVRDCRPGDVQCGDAGEAQLCDDAGVWQTTEQCDGACELGLCR